MVCGQGLGGVGGGEDPHGCRKQANKQGFSQLPTAHRSGETHAKTISSGGQEMRWWSPLFFGSNRDEALNGADKSRNRSGGRGGDLLLQVGSSCVLSLFH